LKVSNRKPDDLNRLVSRRDILAFSLITAACTILPGKVFAASEKVSKKKELFFYNVYTREHLNVEYWRDGMYLPEGLADINHIFRDVHSGTEKAIDINLLDLLFEIKEQIKSGEPYTIMSGYRTPKTNEFLRMRRKGVAKNSLHMYGKAVDIRIPGYSLRGIRRVAMKLRAGGIGYYPRLKFLHLDVGDVRYWRG
jgi:uncharacterized protein YcbK (DUF882 family)